ncbi:MAG TPA: cytochrome P450 [Pseudolysinimonas sp.]|nr:cytochrome P450 [Pseudolysinimonas sp.]
MSSTTNTSAPAASATPLTPPIADWVSVDELLKDPYPSYARLRAESPVAWVPAVNRYLVTTFAGCHTVDSDQELFTTEVTGPGALMRKSLGGTPMLRKDDPEHAVDRAVVNRLLRPRALREAWLPKFEATAQTYIDRLREIGPDEANLDQDYASPVASQNMIDLLGLPDATIDDMHRWSASFMASTSNLADDPDVWLSSENSQAEINAALDEMIPYYRANPDSSIVSAFANSDLPRENISANINLAISGGMNEPQHTITTSVLALSQNPEQLAAARADESVWGKIFEEAVRWISPIAMYPRMTTQDTVVEGYAVPKGSLIGVVIASANRDEAQFERPDTFDYARTGVAHMGFGNGVHLCAGQWAARLSIGEVAVPRLYESLPGLRVDDRREVVFDGWVFRGARKMPVTWDA